MAFKAGHLCKVTLGEGTVSGMGNWKLSGVAVDMMESTAFGDTAKQFISGLLDYGTVTFSGLYDPADTTGQAVLISDNINNVKNTNIMLYVDSTSYWTPDTTTVTDAGLYMQSFNISVDKSGLAQIDFTGKCTGPWALV